MNLYLIGYRGSGKSSVAPLVAEILDWKFADTDHDIQIMTGQTIATIFEQDGESAFRDWETTVVQAYAVKSEYVVSLGGGAPTVPAIFQLIKSSGKTIYLSADPTTLWQRISSDDASANQRPALSDLEGLAEVETMLLKRAEIYDACADYTIDTTELTPQQIANAIANWWDPVDV